MKNVMDKIALFYAETLSSKYADITSFDDIVGKSILNQITPSKHKEKMSFSCGACTTTVSNYVDKNIKKIIHNNSDKKINIWDIHCGFTGRFIRIKELLSENVIYTECDTKTLLNVKKDCLEKTDFYDDYSAINKNYFDVNDNFSLPKSKNKKDLNIVIIQNTFNIIDSDKKKKILQYLNKHFDNCILIIDLVDSDAAKYDNRNPITYTGVEGVKVHGILGKKIEHFFAENNFNIISKDNIFRIIFSSKIKNYKWMCIFNLGIFKSYFATKFCLYVVEKKKEL